MTYFISHCNIYFTQIYDPLVQVMHWTTYRRWSDGEGDYTKETRIACRFTHLQELEALLQRLSDCAAIRQLEQGGADGKQSRHHYYL